MTRRGWVLLIFALAVTVIVVGLVFDDGSDDWHGGGGIGGTLPPRRSPVDDEAMNAGRQQFEHIFARCGEIHRAQRTELESLGGGPRGGPTIARPVAASWEYRGVTFESRPDPLRQVDGFNKITWHGDVIVSFQGVREPGRGDRLWQTGEPLVVKMQKRNGIWERQEPGKDWLADAQKQRWSGRC